MALKPYRSQGQADGFGSISKSQLQRWEYPTTLAGAFCSRMFAGRRRGEGELAFLKVITRRPQTGSGAAIGETLPADKGAFLNDAGMYAL